VSTKRLPDNVLPIWTPKDSVDTAQQFHLELDNAERGTWLVSHSRRRKAGWMDAVAVALLMALMAALGVVVFAASAKADVDNVVFAYTQVYGSAVCETLDDGHDSVDGLTGILRSIVGDGLTPHQAGQVVAMSVTDSCPQYTPLLRAYVARSGAGVA
jgi:hypothetical protein